MSPALTELFTDPPWSKLIAGLVDKIYRYQKHLPVAVESGQTSSVVCASHLSFRHFGLLPDTTVSTSALEVAEEQIPVPDQGQDPTEGECPPDTEACVNDGADRGIVVPVTL